MDMNPGHRACKEGLSLMLLLYDDHSDMALRNKGSKAAASKRKNVAKVADWEIEDEIMR